MKWYSTLLFDALGASAATLAGSRILVIEDNLCLQLPLIRTLKKIAPDTTVDWATTADEVKTNIEKGNVRLGEIYSLVISDITLPGTTSGLDLWKMCSRDFPQLKFIMMSGISIQEYSKATNKHPGLAPQFLHKPFTLDQCNEMITELLTAA